MWLPWFNILSIELPPIIARAAAVAFIDCCTNLHCKRDSWCERIICERFVFSTTSYLWSFFDEYSSMAIPSIDEVILCSGISSSFVQCIILKSAVERNVFSTLLFRCELETEKTVMRSCCSTYNNPVRNPSNFAMDTILTRLMFWFLQNMKKWRNLHNCRSRSGLV